MCNLDVLPAHDAIIRLVVGGFWDHEVEESPFVTLELQAESADAAEDLAQQLAAFSLREAGLEAHTLPLVWVTPLDGEQESHRFLEQAKSLFGDEQFDLAVVAAQIHFELQLKLLLERASRRIGTKWAARLVNNRRVATLSNEISEASIQLLLGVDVTESEYWPEFKAHLSRRNAVVHEGRTMGPKEAEASIKVVQALWATLAQAERAATLF
jgi:hypothetical protein